MRLGEKQQLDGVADSIEKRAVALADNLRCKQKEGVGVEHSSGGYSIV